MVSDKTAGTALLLAVKAGRKRVTGHGVNSNGTGRKPEPERNG